MPKTVLILRHAKSSWDDPTLPDYQRPLNKRGKRDAPLVGEWLRSEDKGPDLIISSGAKRTVQTVKAVVRSSGYDGQVQYSEAYYEGDADTWLEAILRLPAAVNRVLLVGHNPVLEVLVEALSGESVSMPTAALAEIELPVERWEEFSEGTGRLVLYRRPEKM